MRSRIAMLAASLTVATLAVAGCGLGSETDTSSDSTAAHVTTKPSNVFTNPAPTTSHAAPVAPSGRPSAQTPQNEVNTPRPELTISYPVVETAQGLTCDDSVQTTRIVPDANGYGKGFQKFITLITNPGFLRLEWGKEEGLTQALIVEGKRWAPVSHNESATVLEYADWGNHEIDPNKIVLCGNKK